MNKNHLAIFSDALLHAGADRSWLNLVHRCIVSPRPSQLQTPDFNHQHLWQGSEIIHWPARMSTNLPCSKTMLAPTCFFCFSLRLLYSGSAWQHWLCCVFLLSSPGAGRQYQKPPESRGSGKNRATIKPRGRCRSCGGGRERLGREQRDPPTRWRRCRSDDPPQGIPRGPKSNAKQQKMRLVDKFFVNLETEVGRLFLWDPQLLNHQNGRKNQSIKREMSRERWTLLTCSLSCPWSSPCVWHSRAPCCSPTSKRFPLKAGIII